MLEDGLRGRGWWRWAVAGLALLEGCRAHTSEAPPVALAKEGVQIQEGELSRRAMQLDLDDWVRTLEAVHPDPYTRVERSQFLADVQAARDGLPARADSLQFYATLQRLASKLHDSHTSAHYPASSRAYHDAWWPMALVARDGHLLVGSTERGLLKGTRITSVSGWSADRLLQAGTALSNTETLETAQLEAPLTFGVLLWEAGVRGPFRVQGTSPVGTPVSAWVPGVVPLEQQAPADDAPNAFRLEWLEGNVARLTIDAMTDVEGFAQFIEAATEQLRKRAARALLVDLRENSGGDTTVGELLLERLIDKPYRMAAEKHWRVSKAYQAHATRNKAYLAATPGTTLHYSWDAEAPRDVSPRYSGPVCFLIGPNTASSAMMLANAVEDYDLGTLIGEPTSSPPNYFGEVYVFQLPRTKLKAQASSARFVRANGDSADPNPVQPDIRVVPTLEQWLHGEDVVLARALEWARSGG